MLTLHIAGHVPKFTTRLIFPYHLLSLCVDFTMLVTVPDFSGETCGNLNTKQSFYRKSGAAITKWYAMINFGSQNVSFVICKTCFNDTRISHEVLDSWFPYTNFYLEWAEIIYLHIDAEFEVYLMLLKSLWGLCDCKLVLCCMISLFCWYA